MAGSLPEYVFRGTTYNFEGGSNSTSAPYRCFTSGNPVKACYFAIACKKKFSESPVIYIAETEKLIAAGVESIRSQDAVAVSEEEIIWVIKPKDFYKHCEGYVTLKELRDALDEIGQPLNHSPDHNMLSAAYNETGNLAVNEIEKLIAVVSPFIKFP